MAGVGAVAGSGGGGVEVAHLLRFGLLRGEDFRLQEGFCLASFGRLPEVQLKLYK